MVGSLGPVPAQKRLLTSSRARRKARGSFSARKVPAEASYGRMRQERERESMRQGLGRISGASGSPGPAALPRLSYLTHRVHNSPGSVFLPTGSLSNEVRGTRRKPPLGRNQTSEAGSSQARAGSWEIRVPGAASPLCALGEARAPGAGQGSGGLRREGLGWGGGSRGGKKASRRERAAIGQLRASGEGGQVGEAEP